MEMVSKEEAEPWVLNMLRFLNTDTHLESLFVSTACIYTCVHTHASTYTRLPAMFTKSVLHISPLIDAIDDRFIHLVADPFKWK